jgi:hypothetical protein
MMSVNIGDTIKYHNIHKEEAVGKIIEVFSDMDSYEDMELHDGVAYYASKKITAAENKRRKAKGLGRLSKPVFVPVKEKNIKSVFISVEPAKGKTDYIFLEEIHGIS